MKNIRSTIFLLAVLIALLGALAFLQFRWLDQISRSEKEQTLKRLQNDTEHFADDFNQMIQAAYFPFQINSDENWQANFAAHYREWYAHAAYPELISGFTYISKDNRKLRFDMNSGQFVEIETGESFDDLKKDFTPIDRANLILRMPVYEGAGKVDEIKFVTKQNAKSVSVKSSGVSLPPTITLSEASSYLLIQLDEPTITDKILPDLRDKYFSDGNFQIAVVQDGSKAIFQTQAIENADVAVKLFALKPDNFAVFVNNNLMRSLDGSAISGRGKIVMSRRFETKTEQTSAENSNSKINVTIAGNNSARIFQNDELKQDGIWTLNARHAAGSLDISASNARNHNLAISFGILFLLGASVAAIFVSAQRAKIFAQRQVDFVSSVSHEFRTPLAVIYSAGENLADGVAKEENQVSRYGELIKGEGRKLTAMVEQILDFAGANSGKKKYDRRQTGVREIVENALGECETLLRDFTVETEFGENLTPILADRNALSQSLQNLIGNSVKYSNGEKYLKISAQNSGEKIIISVQDKGLGITPHDLKHVFEPFYRAKSVVDEQIHGNGLGLSLVKNTIEAHKGKIEVESEIGKGSKFTIQISALKS